MSPAAPLTVPKKQISLEWSSFSRAGGFLGLIQAVLLLLLLFTAIPFSSHSVFPHPPNLALNYLTDKALRLKGVNFPHFLSLPPPTLSVNLLLHPSLMLSFFPSKARFYRNSPIPEEVDHGDWGRGHSSMVDHFPTLKRPRVQYPAYTSKHTHNPPQSALF